jgi:general secretion pathway protein H
MTPTSPVDAHYAERGFTLVELLVVVTMLAMMSAVVVISLPDGSQSLKPEVERFAARADAARERALIDGRAVSLKVTPSGYSFEQRRGAGWEALSSRSFEPHQWNPGTTSAQSRTVFDAAGLTEPSSIVIQREGERMAVEIAADGAVHVRGSS